MGKWPLRPKTESLLSVRRFAKPCAPAHQFTTAVACTPPGDEDYEGGLKKRQMVLDFDMATWKVSWCRAFYETRSESWTACHRCIQHHWANDSCEAACKDKTGRQVVRLGMANVKIFIRLPHYSNSPNFMLYNPIPEVLNPVFLPQFSTSPSQILYISQSP